MGNNTSKKESIIAKTPQKTVATINDQSISPLVENYQIANRMLDPKTPSIPQTPLTQTIANHLNQMAEGNLNHQNQMIKTPSYLLRKRILYDLGYTYSIKETDPRSPSLSIPRTPLKLDECETILDDSQAGSFQYNSTLEDSCRDFYAKLDDITMDEAEIAMEMAENENDDSQHPQDELSFQKTPECESDNKPFFETCTYAKVRSVCDGDELSFQKTPECESDKSPFFEICTDATVHSVRNEDELSFQKTLECQADITPIPEICTDSKVHSVRDGDGSDPTPKTTEENISPNIGMFSTPFTSKTNRNRRTPLSVINRRHALANNVTPLHSKNDQESYSVEMYKKNNSFNKFDECRGSAHKSKIPVYKK